MNSINDFVSFISVVGTNIYECKYNRCDEDICTKVLSEFQDKIFSLGKDIEMEPRIFEDLNDMALRVNDFFQKGLFDEALSEIDRIPGFLEPIFLLNKE